MRSPSARSVLKCASCRDQDVKVTMAPASSIEVGRQAPACGADPRLGRHPVPWCKCGFSQGCHWPIRSLVGNDTLAELARWNWANDGDFFGPVLWTAFSADSRGLRERSNLCQCMLTEGLRYAGHGSLLFQWLSAECQRFADRFQRPSNANCRRKWRALHGVYSLRIGGTPRCGKLNKTDGSFSAPSRGKLLMMRLSSSPPLGTIPLKRQPA
jgi:hypothetical protein